MNEQSTTPNAPAFPNNTQSGKLNEYLEMFRNYLAEDGFPFYEKRHTAYITRLLSLIETRDLELLKILHYGNHFSRQVFTRETGIRLERADYKTFEILADYIGRDKVTARDAAIEAEKQAAMEKKRAEKQAEFDTLNAKYHGFFTGKESLRIANIHNALEKHYSFSGTYSGFFSVREFIDMLIARNECKPEIVEEPRYKDVSCRRYNRMNRDEQIEHDRKVRDGGTINVYYVNGYKLGKTAYDYAVFRLSQNS